MSKLKLSSNVFASLFAVVTLTVAGCGGSSTTPADGGPDAATGGKGGAGGTAGAGGKGTGGAGGAGGTAGSHTGGAGGSATGGAAGSHTGGAAGSATGGAAGSATGGAAGSATGGAAGSATGGAGGSATGGAGGTNVCGEVAVCTADAVRCTAGVPQKCVKDATGCPQWVNQTVCGTHQTCDNTTGACVCNAEPRCGTPGAEGNFCPTAGGATFSVCSKDTNGCFVVSAEGQACTSPQTCQSTGVVAAGTACGCPAAGTTLNSGCATLAATAASPTDNAVLQCQMVGACKLWRILVNCADQSLTAGTDAINNAPACVCKPAGSAPGAANALYVDPDPPMAISMTNGPTGVLQPPACRLRKISDAITARGTTFTRIVAIHESSSTAHFTGEALTQPLDIPAGITLTTADAPSFNTAHYTIDLGDAATGKVTLANGSNLSGYTLLGGAAANVDLLGCSSGSATADHLAIAGSGTQTGVAVRGNCALTGSLISMSGTGTGVNVTYSAATGAASFTGSSIVVSAIGTGLLIGNANSSATISSTPTVASSLKVTGNGVGVSIALGTATLTSTAVTVQGSGTGVNLAGGTVTLTTSPVTVSGGGTGVGLSGGTANLTTSPVVVSGAAGVRGIVNMGGAVTLAMTGITLSGAIDANARGVFQNTVTDTGTASFSMTGGSITLPTASALAYGVELVKGTATLAGVTETVGGNVTGIQVENSSALTVNGASVLTTSCKIATAAITDCDTTVKGVTGSNAGQGIAVPPGALQQGATVTVGGTTQISGFQDGISSGDGSLTVSGTVQVTGNVHNGIVLAGENGNTTTQVNITGATVSGNGNQGISVLTNIPTQVLTSTVSGNQSDGINVAGSQNTTVNGYQFLLSGSTVSMNGNAAALDGRGVFLSATGGTMPGMLGKVGARLENNHINNNVLEGVRVEGRTAAMSSPTEVTFNTNHISGNLTAIATAPASFIGGGVFFASGAIKLGQFIGNRVFGNGANEIGFAVAQDVSQLNAAAWDLSSDAPGVFDAGTCADAAKPNYVYCYGTTGQLGVAVTTPLTIPVKIKGMHFANSNPTGGVDFTAGIPEPTGFTMEPTAGVFASCTPAGAMAFCADIP